MAVGHISYPAKRYQEQFFASLPSETKKTSRFVEPVAFGFTPQDANEIARLFPDGIKRATGSLLWPYQADAKPLPTVGGLWVVIGADSNPVCIAQTTKVEIIPFNEVGVPPESPRDFKVGSFTESQYLTRNVGLSSGIVLRRS